MPSLPVFRPVSFGPGSEEQVVTGMIGRLVSLLRPTPREIVMLAKREADPRYAREFEGIHLGLVPSFALLGLIAVAGGVAAPFRIILRLLKPMR
jgi:hypothetical protein